MKTINDLSFANKRALVRVDFNVPLDESGRITNDARMAAAIPTLKKILADGGSAVILTHLGRPKDGFDSKLSTALLVSHLQDLLGVPVHHVDEVIGDKALDASKNLPFGEVLLVENVRFHPEETVGDVDFARKLAELGDVYVNDAFGTAHRAHASTAVVAKFFPEARCFGLLMANEITNVNLVLESTNHPVTAVVGGAKVSSKISILENLIPRVDHLVIGGGMAYTFLKAQGGQVGNSLVEEDFLELARKLVHTCKERGVTLHLPVDSVNADSFSAEASARMTPAQEIPEGWMGLDIGPKTAENYAHVLLNSAVILWNGPMGVFEFAAFAEGTKKVGEAIAQATEKGAFSLVGGGDSVSAVHQFGLVDKVSYISTGGGAMLEYLEGKTLPGIKAILEDAIN